MTDAQMFTQQRVNERIRERDLEYGEFLKGKRSTAREVGLTKIVDTSWTVSMKTCYTMECSNGHEWTYLQLTDDVDEFLLKCPDCLAAKDTVEVRYVEPQPFDPTRPIKGSGVQFSPGAGRWVEVWTEKDGLMRRKIW